MSDIAALLSSDSVEHYTPGYIVEAARATLGNIDLDPFSCQLANTVVKAATYSTEGGFDHGASCVVFVPPVLSGWRSLCVARFCEAFEPIGRVVVPEARRAAA